MNHTCAIFFALAVLTCSSHTFAADTRITLPPEQILINRIETEFPKLIQFALQHAGETMSADTLARTITTNMRGQTKRGAQRALTNKVLVQSANAARAMLSENENAADKTVEAIFKLKKQRN